MSKENTTKSKPEILTALGTRSALKKKLSSLTDSQLEKASKMFAEVTAEIFTERQVAHEEQLTKQKLVQEALERLSQEHNIPLDEIKAHSLNL
jgi:hypothetical protein